MRRAGAHRRARADRGKAGQPHRGVAVPVLDRRRIDAEPLGEHAREHGGMALAGRLHVEPEHQLAVAGERRATALSVGMAPACSSMQETPMPRSFLRFADSRLRLLKLA